MRVSSRSLTIFAAHQMSGSASIENSHAIAFARLWRPELAQVISHISVMHPLTGGVYYVWPLRYISPFLDTLDSPKCYHNALTTRYNSCASTFFKSWGERTSFRYLTFCINLTVYNFFLKGLRTKPVHTEAHIFPQHDRDAGKPKFRTFDWTNTYYLWTMLVTVPPPSPLPSFAALNQSVNPVT